VHVSVCDTLVTLHGLMWVPSPLGDPGVRPSIGTMEPCCVSIYGELCRDAWPSHARLFSENVTDDVGGRERTWGCEAVPGAGAWLVKRAQVPIECNLCIQPPLPRFL
jgi:hypothetical protein